MPADEVAGEPLGRAPGAAGMTGDRRCRPAGRRHDHRLADLADGGGVGGRAGDRGPVGVEQAEGVAVRPRDGVQRVDGERRPVPGLEVHGGRHLGGGERREAQIAAREVVHLALDGARDEHAGHGDAGERDGHHRDEQVHPHAERAAHPHAGATPSR